jgi:hypothetical protein
MLTGAPVDLVFSCVQLYYGRRKSLRKSKLILYIFSVKYIARDMLLRLHSHLLKGRRLGFQTPRNSGKLLNMFL